MKKIVLSLAALAAISTGALASSAFDKQVDRNMIENPGNYSMPNTVIGHTSVVSTADALAIEDNGLNVSRFGNKLFVGPGEDGNQAR